MCVRKVSGLNGCDEASRRRVRQSRNAACRRRRGAASTTRPRTAAPVHGRRHLRLLRRPGPDHGRLCLKGPLDGAGPIRTSSSRRPRCSPSSACSGVAAVWAPVSLHYRGNTYLFVLEEVPLLIGLVFLSPDYPRPQRGVRRRLRLHRPAAAGLLEGGVQRDLDRAERGGRRHRLPRDPGDAQSRQPLGLGRRGGRPGRQRDHHVRGAAGRDAS